MTLDGAVLVALADPVGSGIVASLAQPGGDCTNSVGSKTGYTRHRHRRLLRARRTRPRRRAAEQRDELAAFQLIELQSVPPARAGLEDIELARISQEVNTPDLGFYTVDRARSRASASPAVEPGCALPNRLEQVPVAARIGQDGSSGDRGSIHGPDSRQAVPCVSVHIHDMPANTFFSASR
jgi:hypothetical protein